MAKEKTPAEPSPQDLPAGLDDDAAVEALAGLGAEALMVEDPEAEAKPRRSRRPPEADEEAEAEAEDTEEAEAEEESEDEDAEETDEAEGKEEDGEPAFSTVADLAKEFGVKPDEFLASVAVDGPNGTQVPLADALESWRNGGMDSDARKAFETEQATFREREQKFRAQEAEGLTALTAATDRLLSTIEAEPKIDWAQLEKDDPLEYVRQRQKAQERREALGEAIGRIRAAESEQAQRQQEEFVNFQRAEARKAVEAFPAWKDKQVATKAMNQVTSWLRSNGWSDEEMNQLADHRLIIGAWKASEYDRLKAAKPAKLKKARGAPKAVPLHARRGKGQDTRTRQRLRRTLERTGDDRVAAKLLEAHV